VKDMGAPPQVLREQRVQSPSGCRQGLASVRRQRPGRGHA
jgi:hypothetical protein